MSMDRYWLPPDKRHPFSSKKQLIQKYHFEVTAWDICDLKK
jgi:hypothetical protein